MSECGRGYEFTVIEDKVSTETEIPSHSLFYRLKVKLGLEKPILPVTKQKVVTLTNRIFCVDLNNITTIGEVRDGNGKLYLSRCAVFSHPENQWFIVKGRFKDMVVLIDRRFEHKNNIKGYGR